MHVIALVGEGDGGKSSKLKKVILELCTNRGATIQDVQSANRSPSFITPSKIANTILSNYLNQYNDVSVLLHYKGKMVGITTGGDYWGGIKPQFDKIEWCDVLICACHNDDIVFGEIENYQNKYGCRVSSFEKIFNIKCSSDQDTPDLQKCRDLSDALIVKEIISHI